MKNITKLVSIIFLLMLSMSCSKQARHSASFYNKLGADNVEAEGYHANEANRVLDLKSTYKDSNEKAANEKKAETSENLNTINKPNKYNSGIQKTRKKRYNFYM